MAELSFIPFHKPSLGPEESEAVLQVLASKWLTTGPVTLAFQKEFAEYIGCKHALAVNSCTAALQLALDAIGLKPGDEVLVPTYTFTATAEVVTYFGARPVLCDSVPGGFNLDPRDVEKRITEKTRAIIPVHVAGEPCAMGELQALADRYHLHIVEDAAHSLPASYRGKRIGTVSELTAFSFYATKTMTTGEGGMLTTDNDEYAERASVMRLHGIGGDAWKRYSHAGTWYYEVTDAGYKLNLPDLLAAVGRAQLRKCDGFWQERSRIRDFYDRHFSAMEELEIPPRPEAGSDHAWHLYILRLCPSALNISRDEFIEQLKSIGIGTSVHFIPLHRHPYYRREYGYKSEDFSHAENAYSRSISLPIYPDLSVHELERIVQGVESIIQKNRSRTLVDCKS
jgi:dTDP-4-amino-4,6-dideoxygalactose transaminase